MDSITKPFGSNFFLPFLGNLELEFVCCKQTKRYQNLNYEDFCNILNSTISEHRSKHIEVSNISRKKCYSKIEEMLSDQNIPLPKQHFSFKFYAKNHFNFSIQVREAQMKIQVSDREKIFFPFLSFSLVFIVQPI